MSQVNHQFRLAARPVGIPKATDWSLTQEAVGSPGENQLLVKVLLISLDPAMRGWMNDVKSYIPPVKIGDVMRAMAIGQVMESKHSAFQAGEFVSGAFGIQEYALSDGRGVTQVPTDQAPLQVYLSTLGMTGLTAYFGLLDVGKPQPGNTVVISAAAGAVGSVVGQIAKLKGCRVVGIAGGEAKCKYLIDTLGFDAAVDYKQPDLSKALRSACPNGIDVYFDNVGGDILDAALRLLARGARVVICGAISQYNNTALAPGPSNYMSLLVNRASMTGMVVFDYADRYAEAIVEMAGWMKEGKLISQEDIVEGISRFPEAILKLFSGANNGKLILKVGA